jgi:hypothetical protein
MAALLMLTLCNKKVQWSACASQKHGMKSAIFIPIQKCKQIQDTQAWQDVPIDLGHQPALGGVREPRQFLIIIGRGIEGLCRALGLYVKLLRLHVCKTEHESCQLGSSQV